MGSDPFEQSVDAHSDSLGERSVSSYSDRDLDSIEQTTPSVFVWLVAAAAAIGS